MKMEPEMARMRSLRPEVCVNNLELCWSHVRNFIRPARTRLVARLLTLPELGRSKILAPPIYFMAHMRRNDLERDKSFRAIHHHDSRGL